MTQTVSLRTLHDVLVPRGSSGLVQLNNPLSSEPYSISKEMSHMVSLQTFRNLPQSRSFQVPPNRSLHRLTSEPYSISKGVFVLTQSRGKLCISCFDRAHLQVSSQRFTDFSQNHALRPNLGNRQVLTRVTGSSRCQLDFGRRLAWWGRIVTATSPHCVLPVASSSRVRGPGDGGGAGPLNQGLPRGSGPAPGVALLPGHLLGR